MFSGQTDKDTELKRTVNDTRNLSKCCVIGKSHRSLKGEEREKNSPE